MGGGDDIVRPWDVTHAAETTFRGNNSTSQLPDQAAYEGEAEAGNENPRARTEQQRTQPGVFHFAKARLEAHRAERKREQKLIDLHNNLRGRRGNNSGTVDGDSHDKPDQE